jgi:ATP-dependent DNA helicase RecG
VEAREPTSVLDLRGVGPAFARKLAAMEIRTAEDLADVYPRDYKDWREPVPIGQIVREALARGGAREGPDSIETIAVGTVTSVREMRGRLPIVSAQLEDATGSLTATWFGRRGFAGRLNAGDRVFVHGRVALKRRRNAAVSVEMNVLHHRMLPDGEVYRGRIVPVYRASKEVPSREIAGLIAKNEERLQRLVRDVVPRAIEHKHGFGSLPEAWREVHFPQSIDGALRARERLLFERFFALALAAALKRARRDAEGGAPALAAPPGLLEEFEAQLPFRLTGAQRATIATIYADMERSAPMNRLLQGDVGSGKTLVAAAAIVLAQRGGVQSALMAPTELLAAQHARNVAPLLLPFGVRVDAVSGSQTARARAGVQDRLASGECDLAVGTHALLTETVAFRRLGLAIVDEQHRFGVMQRARLRSKSRAPHTLYMTATPIPRTLAQSRYADLDLSVLDELPPGRTPIETFLLREGRKRLAYEFVRRNVDGGRQAYIVAPAIGGDDAESDAALTSAVAEFEALRDGPLGGIRVALLHGRLPAREKDAIMERFVRHELDALMATTVVEVGVDVQNATVMVILDAHRYGLAQLHQLRGRVGRGAAASYCILIAPERQADEARLAVLLETNDGFRIAEEDLRLRRAGEFAGEAQAGGDGLFGEVAADFHLYMRAKADADALVASDPALEAPEHRGLLGLVDADATARAMLLSS